MHFPSENHHNELPGNDNAIDYFIPEAYRLSKNYPLRINQEKCVIYYTYEDGVAGREERSRQAPRPDTVDDHNVHEKAKDLKQHLMGSLLGDVADGAPLGPVSRALTAPNREEEIQARIVNGLCDCTNITSPSSLVVLVSYILGNLRHNNATDTITAIDLSHTVLGTVGPSGPPTEFDHDGNPVPSPRSMRFFPDERIPFTKTPLKTRQDIAQRRLCLAYIAPLLYLDGGLLFHIKLFVCRYAQLTDHDAAAVARILEEKTCTVEQMDLSHNAITDKGVKEFVDALKKNKTLVELILTENDQITSEKLLKSVERHLRRNREQKEKH